MPAPPFPAFACSLPGCVPKKPDSWRSILDLSAHAGSNVNDGVPEAGAVLYVRFDQIFRMFAQLGRGALIAKVDLRRAFHQMPGTSRLLALALLGNCYADLRLSLGHTILASLAQHSGRGDLCSAALQGRCSLEHYLGVILLQRVCLESAAHSPRV